MKTITATLFLAVAVQLTPPPAIRAVIYVSNQGGINTTGKYKLDGSSARR